VPFRFEHRQRGDQQYQASGCDEVGDDPPVQGCGCSAVDHPKQHQEPEQPQRSKHRKGDHQHVRNVSGDVLDAPLGEHHAGHELDGEHHPDQDVDHRADVFPSGADVRLEDRPRIGGQEHERQYREWPLGTSFEAIHPACTCCHAGRMTDYA